MCVKLIFNETNLSFDYQLEVLKLSYHNYMNGIKGTSQIISELQINDRSFREWIRKYNLLGREGLKLFRRKRR